MAKETIKSVKEHYQKENGLLLARCEELADQVAEHRENLDHAIRTIREHLDEHRTALAKQIQVMEQAIKQRAILEGAIVNGQELLAEINNPPEEGKEEKDAD